MAGKIEPFTDEDIMVFGKHKGKKLSDVPASYLDWWANFDGTISTLRLYKYYLVNKDVIDKELEEKDNKEKTSDYSESIKDEETPF